MAELAPRSPPIVRLIAPGGPAAIVGLVASVIVDPIERKFWAWAGAHVGEEENEVAPPFADHDTTSAVVFEALAIRIATPLKHRRPDSVLGEPFATRGLSVVEVPGCENFAMKATARARTARSQIAAWKKPLFATVATTLPQLPFGNKPEHNQATKASACNVDKAWHSSTLDDIYIGVNWPTH